MKKIATILSLAFIFFLVVIFHPTSSPFAVTCSSTDGDTTISSSCTYPADSSVKTVNDVSTNVNTGTATGASIVSGKYGSARSFNGSSDYISLSSQPPFGSTAFSFSAWIKIPNLGTSYTAKEVFNNNQFFLRLDPYSEAPYRIAAFTKLSDASVEPRAVTSTNIPTDTWQHIAVTWDGTTLRIYRNGILENFATRSGTLTSTTVLAQIGRGEQTSTTVNYWNGQIDDVRIYNYSRSESQIGEDMNNAASLTGNAPVGHWKMDDGYVSGVDNGNVTIAAGNTLTINAGQTFVWNPGKSITIENGGSIVVSNTAQLRQDYLWVADGNGNGWVYEGSLVASSVQPTGYVRRNTIIGNTFGDGSDGDVTFNTNTNLSTTAVASGRISADGVSYPVTTIGTNTATGNLGNLIKGWWKIDEVSGTSVADSSGNGYNGTAIGTTIVTGKYGNARSFNGTASDYIYFGGLTWTPTAFTVEWWLYPKTCTDYNQTMKATNGWDAFVFHTTSDCRIYVGTNIGTRFVNTDFPVNTLAINQWQHFAYTYDGTSGRVYKNGALIAGPKAQTSPTAWGGFVIGTNGTNTINGYVDDVRIYGYARTQPQIQSDMNNLTSFGIAADDNVLLINLQGSATYNGNVGNYEFLKVQSASGNTITFTSNIQKIYGASASNADLTGQKVVLQRVPQYQNVTINEGVTVNANTWGGTSGGVLAMKVNGTFTANTGVGGNGTLSMAEKGYRGGDCNGCGNNAWGDQGEGIKGLGTGTLSANINGGGGGYGPSGLDGEPGAGGGHGTAGGIGDGVNDATGGQAVGEQTLGKLFMGGGGGGGGDNDGATPFPEYRDGGGIIILLANTISSLYIDAQGEDAFWPGATTAGVAGGGAGGSILIKGANITLSTVTSAGGAQVIDDDNKIGGAGGSGRNAIYYISSLSGSTTPAAYTSQGADP